MSLNYWVNYESKFGDIYSFDMLRFRLSFDLDHIQTIVDKLMSLYEFSDLDVSFFHSMRMGSYRNLFVLSVGDSVVTLGIGFIAKSEDINKGFLEFNPNKVYQCDILKRILHFVFNWSESCDLVRFDLAVDVPILRPFVSLFSEHGKTYSLHKCNSCTEYLGQRNKVGFVKVYDKTKESKLDYPLTRIEVTCDLDHIFNIFPRVSLNRNLAGFYFSQLKDTDICILSMLNKVDCPDYYLHMLGRAKYKQISSFYDVSLLDPDFECMVNIYNDSQGMVTKIFLSGDF